MPGQVKKLQKFINFCLKVGHSANLKYSKSTWRQSSCDFCEMYKISTSLYISFFLSHHIYPLFISESLHLSEPIIITNFLGLFHSVCACQLIFCNLYVYDSEKRPLYIIMQLTPLAPSFFVPCNHILQKVNYLYMCLSWGGALSFIVTNSVWYNLRLNWKKSSIAGKVTVAGEIS